MDGRPDILLILFRISKGKQGSDGWQVVAYDIPKGNIATYFPESNVLVPLDSTAHRSNTPTSKWIVCSLLEPGQASSEEE